MTEWWWAYAGLGAFVGFFSGLLGIGGGSATVPVLAFVFAAKGFPEADVVHLALGTGISTMLFTSVASLWSHHRRRAVNWAVLRAMVPGLLLGTFGGALLAGFLNVRWLSLAFTAVVFYYATRMILPQVPRPADVVPRRSVMAAFGTGVGVISSLSATGGAALVVPFLVKRNIAIHHAIGTAAAIGWPIAAAGTVGYVLGGMSVSSLPPYSAGYVYLPAMIGVALASVIAAPIGAAVAHRTPGGTLRKVFAIVLFALGTIMLIKFL